MLQQEPNKSSQMSHGGWQHHWGSFMDMLSPISVKGGGSGFIPKRFRDMNIH